MYLDCFYDVKIKSGASEGLSWKSLTKKPFILSNFWINLFTII